MDFDVGDIKAAFNAQVVGGMFYDRRVFLVVDTGDGTPTVIAFMPHQAEAIARDLANPSPDGEVHTRDRRLEPVLVRLNRPSAR